MVSVILLVAFTVGVGGLISVWITGLTSTQTGTVGNSGEKAAQCGTSSISILEARYSTSGAALTKSLVNVTVSVASGTESIGNFTVTVSYKGVSNTTAANQTVLQPGQVMTIAANASNDGNEPELIRVRGLCQNSFALTDECKAGQNCMKAV